MTETKAVNTALLGSQMGLFAGLLCVAYLAAFYFASPQLLFSPWVLFSLAFIVFFKIANAYLLWTKTNNQVSFKEALASIFMVSVISLLLVVIFYYEILNHFDPAVLDPVKKKLTDNAAKSFDENRITKVQLDETLLRIQNISFSVGAASITYSLLLIVGFFYSIVFAGIMRLISRDIAIRTSQQ